MAIEKYLLESGTFYYQLEENTDDYLLQSSDSPFDPGAFRHHNATVIKKVYSLQQARRGLRPKGRAHGRH